MEFEIDTSKHRGVHIRGIPKQVNLGNFMLDTQNQRRHIRDHIEETLLNGWRLRDYKPRMVVRPTDLPTMTTISKTFGVSPSTAYKVIKDIVRVLHLYVVDQKKRYERGDWLVKLQRERERDRIVQLSLKTFYNKRKMKKRIKLLSG